MPCRVSPQSAKRPESREPRTWFENETIGPPNFSAGGSLLDQINKTRVIRCDEAAWRFLGLSLAGYNVLVSLFLAGVAAWGAAGAWRTPDREYSGSTAE